VSWIEVPYAEVRGRGDIMQALWRQSMAIRCAWCRSAASRALYRATAWSFAAARIRGHTGEVGLFRIVSEGAVAAGVRRIEAIAGLTAHEQAVADTERLKQLAATLGAPLPELEKKLAALLAQQKELERQLESVPQEAGRRHRRAARSQGADARRHAGHRGEGRRRDGR